MVLFLSSLCIKQGKQDNGIYIFVVEMVLASGLFRDIHHDYGMKGGIKGDEERLGKEKGKMKKKKDGRSTESAESKSGSWKRTLSLFL